MRAHRWSEQQRTRNENSMFARLAKIVAGQRPEPFLPESNVMELNAKPDVEIQEIQEVEEIENRKTEAEMIEALVSSFS